VITSTAAPILEPRELPTQLTALRIEEAKRHLHRARGSLLLIWPNGGSTHQHAADCFAGIDKALEALS
jgi:hypothetical protein